MMSIQYLLLNYFSCDFFVNNGTGSTYDEKTESTINKMENKNEILDLCDKLKTWYEQNKDSINNINKMAGIASKSLDSFSISYRTDYTQSLVDLLPFDLLMMLKALGIYCDSTISASLGGFLY